MTANEMGLLGILVVVLLLALRWRKELGEIRNRFSKVIDLDLEAKTIENEISKLKTAKEAFETDFQGRKRDLQANYESAVIKYEKLQREVSILEESLEMIDFGVYKPHFNFSDSETYKKQLELLYDKEKDLIRKDMAVRCSIEWSVGGSKKEGQKMTQQNHKLMLRAFNGECDAALAKVRWDNILKMEERVIKAFEAINKAAEVNKSYITRDFLDLKIKELRLSHELQEKIKQERDEQKRIQEEMREEEKARREMERARVEAEKEESRYQKALEKAREELLKAKGDKVNELSQKIAILEEDLKRANEQKQRAISQAQLTKSGHVYVISNIGSFGESVYKIGMTRRLDPLDRVKELGDASVPFEFDVHAMIYSENAPELERQLQTKFASRRLNLVNPRKEFFYVSLDEIEDWSKNSNFNIQFTKVAEARAYRESKAIREKGEAEKVGIELENQHVAAEKLFDDEENE